LTKYSTSAEVGVPALLRVKVTLVGELTWMESKAILSTGGGGDGPQPVLRQARVFEVSTQYKTRPKVRTMITTMRTLNSFQLNR